MDGVCKKQVPKKQFSSAHTQVLKGLAVLMLLVHHGYSGLKAVTPLGHLVLANSVSLAKLCVAIFTVLSGYGMFCSFQSKTKNASFREATIFIVSHLVKLFLIFWIAASLQIGIVSLIKGNFFEIYGRYPIYYVLLDCMGVSYITGTPKFVNAWWYMTAIAIYYLLFPVLFLLIRRLKKRNYLIVAVSAIGMLFLRDENSILIYGIFFYYGMVFAECDLFQRLLNAGMPGKRFFRAAGWLAVFVLLCIARQLFLYGTGADYYVDWLLTVVLTLFVCECMPYGVSGIIGKLLGVLGAYSFEIYLTHSVFIRYLLKLVYKPAVWYLIFPKLLVMSLLAAIVVRLLEKLLRINQLSRICKSEKGARIAGILLGLGLFVLPAPQLIADQGLGGWAFQKPEVIMQKDNYHVMRYEKLPIFWKLADKTYTSDDNDIVYFIDGIVYAHKTGTTTVSVSLPSGRTLSCTIIVQEE